jgi:hypothetical protein
MTHPPSEAVDLTHLILHCLKHLVHVGKPQLVFARSLVLAQGMKLAGGNRVRSTTGNGAP